MLFQSAQFILTPKEYSLLVLRSEIPSGMCAKLRTMAASNNRDHPTRSLSSSPLASTINCSPGSQALSEVTHHDHSIGITLLLLVRATYICFCSSRTSRSWWITQSMQHHRRGCNTSNLVLPGVNSSLGKCSLTFVGPKLWSSIPDCVKSSATFTFKGKLKKQVLHQQDSYVRILATFRLSRTKCWEFQSFKKNNFCFVFLLYLINYFFYTLRLWLNISDHIKFP